MMVWSLTAMLSSIMELWRAVDNIVGPFRLDQWERHVLTWVQKQCFSYEPFYHNSRSPFDTIMPNSMLKKFVELYPCLNIHKTGNPSSFFGYSMDEMNRLFPPARHPTIYICRSIEDVLELNESSTNHFDNTIIIICVDSSIPESFSTTTTAIIAY